MGQTNCVKLIKSQSSVWCHFIVLLFLPAITVPVTLQHKGSWDFYTEKVISNIPEGRLENISRKHERNVKVIGRIYPQQCWTLPVEGRVVVFRLCCTQKMGNLKDLVYVGSKIFLRTLMQYFYISVFEDRPYFLSSNWNTNKKYNFCVLKCFS